MTARRGPLPVPGRAAVGPTRHQLELDGGGDRGLGPAPSRTARSRRKRARRPVRRRHRGWHLRGHQLDLRREGHQGIRGEPRDPVHRGRIGGTTGSVAVVYSGTCTRTTPIASIEYPSAGMSNTQRRVHVHRHGVLLWSTPGTGGRDGMKPRQIPWKWLLLGLIALLLAGLAILPRQFGDSTAAGFPRHRCACRLGPGARSS